MEAILEGATNNKKRLTLAIETAIDGGSVSILDGRTEIDFRIGKKEISKAEDVLENIEELLSKNGLNKSAIGKIVVSSEAGSATGLKIGMATAKGLAKGLECELSIVSLVCSLKEILTSASKLTGNKSDFFDARSETIIILPAGKNSIYYKSFSNQGAAAETRTVARELIPDILRKNPQAGIFAHQSIFEQDLTQCSGIKDLGKNMAKYIGLKNASDNEFETL